MPRYERPPVGLEYKSPALAAPTSVAAAMAPRPRPEIHTAVLGPTCIERGGDLITRGAFTKALAARTPKVVIDSDWSRPVGIVAGGAELPPGDPRLPATTPDGAPWPRGGGGLLLRIELMPGTTRDSALAVKALRGNGNRQRWSFGFRVLDGEQRGGVRRITRLDLYSVSPWVDEPERKAATRPSGLEIKGAAGSEAPVSIKLPTDGRWVLTCVMCGMPSGLADRPLPPSARFVCGPCVDAAGRLVDPLAAVDVDDSAAPDPGVGELYEDAQRVEVRWDADPDGVLSRATGGRGRWQP